VETRIRSIVKAITWRAGGLLVTVTVVYAITRKVELAATIGIADTILKLAAFYVHERLWLKVHFGKLRPPDYQI
jgi:adenylylsulfate kinase